MQLLPHALTSKAWMHKYIPLFYMDEVTYLCLNADAGLTNLPEIIGNPEIYLQNRTVLNHKNPQQILRVFCIWF